jgi:restriction system protein
MVITVGEGMSRLSPTDWLLMFTTMVFIAYVIIQFKKVQINKQRERELEENRIRILREGESRKLKVMNPHDFEHYIADLFKLKGFETEVTKRSGDRRKDIILKQGDEIRITECK